MTSDLSTLAAVVTGAPSVWLAVTVLAYGAADLAHRASGRHPVMNPILISVVLIAGVLWLTRTPYATYFDGAGLVHVMVGPATVALAIPLYDQLGRLRTMVIPLTVALLVGSLTAIGSAVALGWTCGASADVLRALAPKSATMPIAMGVAAQIGGVPSLTALMVTITGVSGAILAPRLLDLAGVDDPAIRGFSIGLTAHAIGTAQALRGSPVAGGFAALAMGLNGVATALLLPLLARLVP